MGFFYPEKFDQENLALIIRMLLNNELTIYPIQFIFETMAERIKCLTNKKTLK